MKHAGTAIISTKRNSHIQMFPLWKHVEISLFQRSFPKDLLGRRKENILALKINPLLGKKGSALTVLLTTNSSPCTKTGPGSSRVPIRHMTTQTGTRNRHTKTADPAKNGQDFAWPFFMERGYRHLRFSYLSTFLNTKYAQPKLQYS